MTVSDYELQLAENYANKGLSVPRGVVKKMLESVRGKDALIDALWQCYMQSGADTDGDKDPKALIAGMGEEGFAKAVVSAVTDLRDSYDQSLDEWEL